MVSAVIVAGGVGLRFGRAGGKQLVDVAGLPLVAHSLLAMERCPDVDEVVLVASPETIDEHRELVVSLALTKVARVAESGPRRQDSVRRGLDSVSADADVVVVHDGARPMVTPELVSAAVAALREGGSDGVVVGHPAYDTMKLVGEGLRVLETTDRRWLWAAQTPQVFRVSALRRAHDEAEQSGMDATDDSQLVEAAGGSVMMFEGPRDNIKVTVPEDLAVVEALLLRRG